MKGRGALLLRPFVLQGTALLDADWSSQLHLNPASSERRVNLREGAPAASCLPTITGLFEAQLTVSNLPRSIRFYRDVLGLSLAHTIPERNAAFFWIGEPGQAMLGLWSIHSSPLRMRPHIAFTVTLPALETSISAFRAAGLIPHSGASDQPIEEPVVFARMPAASVYFDDPDGDSLEFICMLPDAPEPDLNRVRLSEWRTVHSAGRQTA